jgi:spoIIIJ-associated protein
MPIQDRVAAAKRVDEVLRNTLQQGGFRLKYRITANPPVTTELGDSPELVVDFSGPDSGLLLERNGELKLAADVAAERVRKTGQPYLFAPMSARERRMLHLAMRDYSDLRTESSGEAERRFVVVYPRDYKGSVQAPVTSGMRGGRRR